MTFDSNARADSLAERDEFVKKCKGNFTKKANSEVNAAT